MANNLIELQEELIEKVNSLDPKGYNHGKLYALATRKFLNRLETLGFSQLFSERAMYDALDMAKLGRHLWTEMK